MKRHSKKTKIIFLIVFSILLLACIFFHGYHFGIGNRNSSTCWKLYTDGDHLYYYNTAKSKLYMYDAENQKGSLYLSESVEGVSFLNQDLFYTSKGNLYYQNTQSQENFLLAKATEPDISYVTDINGISLRNTSWNVSFSVFAEGEKTIYFLTTATRNLSTNKNHIWGTEIYQTVTIYDISSNRSQLLQECHYVNLPDSIVGNVYDSNGDVVSQTEVDLLSLYSHEESLSFIDTDNNLYDTTEYGLGSAYDSAGDCFFYIDENQICCFSSEDPEQVAVLCTLDLEDASSYYFSYVTVGQEIYFSYQSAITGQEEKNPGIYVIEDGTARRILP